MDTEYMIDSLPYELPREWYMQHCNEFSALIHFGDVETDDYKYWHFNDEYFLLGKNSGRLLKWCGNVGRANESSSKFRRCEFDAFLEELFFELKEEKGLIIRI